MKEVSKMTFKQCLKEKTSSCRKLGINQHLFARRQELNERIQQLSLDKYKNKVNIKDYGKFIRNS